MVFQGFFVPLVTWSSGYGHQTKTGVPKACDSTPGGSVTSGQVPTSQRCSPSRLTSLLGNPRNFQAWHFAPLAQNVRLLFPRKTGRTVGLDLPSSCVSFWADADSDVIWGFFEDQMNSFLCLQPNSVKFTVGSNCRYQALLKVVTM